MTLLPYDANIIEDKAPERRGKALLFSGITLIISALLSLLTSVDQHVVTTLAPGQPYDAFFGECPSLVHRDGKTWFAYADADFDIHSIYYDHQTNLFSDDVLVGAGWNDHLRPALLIDDDDYLHMLYGSRPVPIRYHRSNNPFDHSSWSSYELFGSSATYPVPLILGGKLFVLYREGDSYSASLYLAVRDLSTPMGTHGAWSVTRIVEESSIFVPMPLAAFEKDGRGCFLFNMRDALMSSPHTLVAPSIREGMSVITTSDGVVFESIDGSVLDLPLDYTGKRDDFPEVTRRDEYMEISHDEGNGIYTTSRLSYDGSFVEVSVTPSGYDRMSFRFGSDAGCSCYLEFSDGGRIAMTDDTHWIDGGEYQPGTSYRIKLKFSFSTESYRPWINGTLAGPPLHLTYIDPYADDHFIDSIAVASLGDWPAEILTGREFKQITASACLDYEGVVNFFFIDRRDSHDSSYWRLMHQRAGEVVEIGDPAYHKYHPSSILMDDEIFVAVSYFEGDGLFLSNEHLDMGSRIMLLGSRDKEEWEELELSSGPGGHVHPIFKRGDDSGKLELIWARMDSPSSTSLMHSFTSLPDTLFPEPQYDPSFSCFPNPAVSNVTLRLVLDHECSVSIEIYDLAGRVVRRLLTKARYPAGENDIQWDGCCKSGELAGAGVYFARAWSENSDWSTKIVVVR